MPATAARWGRAPASRRAAIRISAGVRTLTMSARARGGLDDHRADPTVARRVVALKAEDLVPSASRSGAGVRGRVAARRTLSAGAGRGSGCTRPGRVPSAAAPGRFPGWLAEARCPAHLRLAWLQLVTERAVLWLVLEQRNGHLGDPALTSRYESMVRAIADVAHIIRQLWRGTQEQPCAGSRSCSPGLTPA